MIKTASIDPLGLRTAGLNLKSRGLEFYKVRIIIELLLKPPQVRQKNESKPSLHYCER